MRKIKHKILLKIIIIISCILVVGITFCLIMGRTRYERKLDTYNNESSIVEHSEFFTRKYLNIYYRFKKIGYTMNKSKNQNKIVFLGDSITDYCDLSKYYKDYETVNYGIGGDTTRGVLNRMYLVYDINPKAIVLLIGINDLMNEKRSVENTFKSYTQIVDELLINLPNTKIILESVYPGCDGTDFKIAYLKDDVIELNDKIYNLSLTNNRLIYADIHSYLVDSNNVLKSDYTYDGCHPNSKGYEVISTNLKLFLDLVK